MGGRAGLFRGCSQGLQMGDLLYKNTEMRLNIPEKNTVLGSVKQLLTGQSRDQ